MSTSKSSIGASSGGDPAGRHLFVRCEEINGHIVARLTTPSIGQRESPIIVNDVTRMFEDVSMENKSLILDFSAVDYINSMGIGMCIELRNHANASGVKQVVLYNLKPEIMQVLKMTRIDKVFTIIDKEKKLEKILAK